jgi:hypothetical protein
LVVDNIYLSTETNDFVELTTDAQFPHKISTQNFPPSD